ncbi:hypothetical protein POZ32_15280 [Bacteroides uniformis]|uniref:Uncharacterized protein n=1 Tax=Bacteroides uniformis TaxID=820 RepID=A0AAW6GGN4_BACUN|nr:hypothetical protein [Bacteroides uniformis]MDC1856265.1 hypothetical protein [Bacteroides uniformis]MDC1873356.1 hypothetical protein [Bacteroides uniformis]
MIAILGFNGILKVVSVCHIYIPTLFTLTNQSMYGWRCILSEIQTCSFTTD